MLDTEQENEEGYVRPEPPHTHTICFFVCFICSLSGEREECLSGTQWHVSQSGEETETRENLKLLTRENSIVIKLANLEFSIDSFVKQTAESRVFT